ncbi:MAG TPA: 3-hydroxyacyl-CoA dehydrogenase NAD-binding domain-containing protein [Thermoanaerobaculia bacterium]|jgi:3-hydroxyacyl-CoA dehydrogenase/enoyl-CoA hydratase/3-hydroxybutyryl-CoA epimerase|nr:3-hydroxyacyl-CoA dehydrogenase NAD-binding domain-containing protein [Thermoanaerobaculia bacterium]
MTLIEAGTRAKTAQTLQTSPPPGALAVEEGIAWLRLDDPGKRVNTLSSRLMAWFEEQVGALGALEGERPRGLVIYSGKPESFVAGADLEELLALQDPESVIALLQRGHELMERLAGLPFPTVAAIHGVCLGGGLELALACRLRVATEHPKTKLGFPEVQLGLIPGLGGTQRLPRRIGVPDALDLILTSKQVDARKARRLGLVDDTCHPADLRTAAERLVREGAPRSRPRPLAARAGDLLARTPLGGKFVWDKARAGAMAKTGGHYPAPLVAIDVVREGLKLPLRRALDLEAGAFSELVVSETAKNLISIFFTKNDVEARAAKLGRKARPTLPGATVGVLGAGFMGAGIAQVLAQKGVRIVLKDRDLAAVGRGYAFCQQQLRERVKRRRATEAEARTAMGRILPTADYDALRRVDLVVEAVFEDLEVKRTVIREAEAAAPPGLIFASNTSSIPIGRLAAASRRPENVVGMHFFSPVAKMPLLEVIRHPGTSEETLATTVELGRTMGKTVIVVGDGPGFFTSRVLGTMLNEAAWMLAGGARIDQVDRAMTRWGWPVGPFALMDEVGLDVGAHVGEIMREALGERVAPPPVFQRMLDDHRLGRKAKRGFYLYIEDGKKGKGARPVDEAVYPLLGWREAPLGDEEIVERCWLQMLNETARCMEEGIITNPADVDVGVIFGFGFPPFRGGLLREADRLGLRWVVDELDGYAGRYGERLRPAALLRAMAERGERFYKG